MSATASTRTHVEMKPLVHGLSKTELAEFCRDAGHAPYRADQVWNALYGRRVNQWSGIHGIPANLRETLSARFDIAPGSVAAVSGAVGETKKLLVDLRDSERVETVLIPADDRRTVCVSCQAGCRYNCAFCASGQSGFRRNLDAGEMTGQVLLAAGEWGKTPTHVVWMGVGEPFDNYEQCLKAVRIVNDKDGLNIGARRLTISTCGIIPGITRLAGEGLQVELSVSLHAVDDKTRSILMPVNRKYPLGNLVSTCRDYVKKTGRIITFEYALIAGVNDKSADAAKLAELTASVPGRINLIPLNAVSEFDGKPSRPEVVAAFMKVLHRAGINATLRQSRGSGIHAACGQLRACHA